MEIGFRIRGFWIINPRNMIRDLMMSCAMLMMQLCDFLILWKVGNSFNARVWVSKHVMMLILPCGG